MWQVMNLPYETNHASVYNRRDYNSSFAEGTLRVMYTGANRNHSYIDRDTVEAALPSLYNVPIVAHYEIEQNEIGGHDVEVRRTGDNGARLVQMAVPCGVVPEHAEFRFEDGVDENGICHEYLVVDRVLLWKREAVYRHIAEDLGGKVDHSMEIGVLNGEFDKEAGVYRIRQFEFQALCLLERDEPCFEGSVLELFSLNNFRARMSEMMQDLKKSFSMVSPDNEDDRDHSKEGGEALENQVTEQMEPVEEEAAVVEEEFDLAKQQEQTVTEESAVEEQVEFSEEAAEDEPAGEADEHAEDGSPCEDADFALNSDLWDELAAAFDNEKLEMPWGLDRRYWLVDFDHDLHEVYVQDGADWKLYGFSYRMNGDRAEVDFASKHRVKYAIVNYDDGNQDRPGDSVFANIAERFSDTIRELQQFKQSVEQKADEEARAEIFGRFTDLAGIEEFEALKQDNAAYTREAMEEKCYAIRGKFGTVAKFSAEPERHKLPVEPRMDEQAKSNEPYGGVFVRFRQK